MRSISLVATRGFFARRDEAFELSSFQWHSLVHRSAGFYVRPPMLLRELLTLTVSFMIRHPAVWRVNGIQGESCDNSNRSP